VGKGVDSPQNQKMQEGALVIWTDTSVKPQRVRCEVGETIEQPCSDVLAHTQKCVRVLVCTMGIQLSRMIMTHGELVQPL
jgi:hypothetical protein